MFNVGIVGSRNFPNERMVRRWIRKSLPELPGAPHAVRVISGGARGVDTWAVDEAKKMGYRTKVFEPDIEEYGVPRAFFVRNGEIVEASDFIVAFWDGDSTGTHDTIDRATKAHLPINIYVRRT